jgi:hypothetical protein
VNERGVQTVCDWTEKGVSLPRQAKRTTAYNVESQSHDEHPRQRAAGLFRGLTGNSVKTPDPLGQVSHAPTSQMSALFPGDAIGEPPPHPPGFIPIPYPIIPNESIDDETDRFARWCEDSERRYKRAHRASLSSSDCMDEEDMPPSSGQALTTTPSIVNDGSPPQLLRAMPRSALRSVFPSGPLNLNPDGTDINYRKSHAGPHADYWAKADGEEIERLFTTGTIRSLLYKDIPADKIVTYVIC